MKKHTLNYYLDQAGTLTPTDDQMRDISTAEWWVKVGEQFDNMIWLYWADREVFYNDRFPEDDDATAASNLVKTFALFLRSRSRMYEKLYKTTVLDYNPLYNVDAYEFTNRELEQTGSTTNNKTGDDTATRSGSESDSKAGSETNVRTGNMTEAGSGSDDTVHQNTTFDSDTLYNTAKDTMTAGTTTTTTYNDVTDTSSFTDREDTHTYNDVQNKIDYNSSTEDIRDLKDKEGITVRRYGNIGVTMSGQLLEDSRREASYDFIKQVVQDCINTVSYAIY